MFSGLLNGENLKPYLGVEAVRVARRTGEVWMTSVLGPCGTGERSKCDLDVGVDIADKCLCHLVSSELRLPHRGVQS